MQRKVTINRRLAAAVLALIIAPKAIFGVSPYVSAQEAVQQGAVAAEQFMSVQQAVDARTEPDESAETAFSYQAGDTVCVTGQTEDGWYIVYYQNQTGYISMAAAQEALSPFAVDVEGLDAEMAAEEETSRLIIEETERYREESRRSKIWASVIIVLVIGIFATGIVSTVQAEKRKGEQV